MHILHCLACLYLNLGFCGEVPCESELCIHLESLEISVDFMANSTMETVKSPKTASASQSLCLLMQSCGLIPHMNSRLKREQSRNSDVEEIKLFLHLSTFFFLENSGNHILCPFASQHRQCSQTDLPLHSWC